MDKFCTANVINDKLKNHVDSISPWKREDNNLHWIYRKLTLSRHLIYLFHFVFTIILRFLVRIKNDFNEIYFLCLLKGGWNCRRLMMCISCNRIWSIFFCLYMANGQFDSQLYTVAIQYPFFELIFCVGKKNMNNKIK